jgi:hypothetical protein
MTLDAASIPKIAGFRFDPQTTESIWWCIEREAVRLVGEQGLHAFEMPRSSAVAHETGHAIVAVHDGVALSYVEITRRVIEGCAAWGGFTQWAQPYPPQLMLVHPAPLRNILLRICSLIAGVVGQKVIDPAGCRDGSSIDEVVVSQVLAEGLAQRDDLDGVEPKKIWNACWHRTVAIIHGNEKAARIVAAKLDICGIVRRKQLDKLTSCVRRLADDPLDIIIRNMQRE